MKSTIITVLAVAMLVGMASTADASLVGYWNFDSYTTGSNPAGMPQGGITGSFADLSGNGNTAYGGETDSANYAPYDAAGGKWGGALYSQSTNNNGGGGFAVVGHNDSINFDGESFTISFWEKVQYRDVTGSGWGDGRGRNIFFMKAPYFASNPGTPDGLGIYFTQNSFRIVGNDDNYGQTTLSNAQYTYPSGSSADDSGVWAHWAMTGQYNAGTDDYAVTLYLNGNAVDMNGVAAGTSVTIANDVIDNPGDLTLGSFWRDNGIPVQRGLSWAMRDTSAGQTDGKAWMDDFAMWDEVLNSSDLTALAAGTTTPQAWVPEPASLALLGLGGLMMLRRRKA